MKKLSFTLLLSLCVLLIQAQSTAYLKVANNGYFEKIEKVSSGGYITTGFDSAYKVQVIRWDNSFNMTWKYVFNDTNIMVGSPKIVEANDGSFYFLMGSHEYTASTWIVKFSSAGALVWQKIYYLTSGNMNSIALSKALPGDNGFLIGGGQNTLSNYIIKCAADGTIEWQNQYLYPLSTGVITCYSIIADGTGYVVSSSYNINSLLTMKISATGSISSHSAYTYTGMQIIPSRIVKLNTTGGYAIVGGYNNTNNNKTEFVAIYNAALSLQSFNELTVTYNQFVLNDITAINNGRSMIVDGSIYDNSAFTIAMINLSNTGSVIWKKRAYGNTTTTNKNVEFRGLTENGITTVHVGQGINEGRVIAVIDSNGNGLCNNDMAFNMTNVHPTLVLQSQTMSVATANAMKSNVSYAYSNYASYNKQIYCGNLLTIDDNTGNQVIVSSIYPNPATDMVNLNIENPDNAKLTLNIYSMTGKLIRTEMLKQNQSRINIDDLNNGIYMFEIKSDEWRTTQKLLINK
ncbi:MAG: T9SS type A sorting domain-containing protein [Bacteroidetes bacterium]|nr:T9SS type A sorting domain-containing protein [Bacteroidota bacterium]